MAPSASSNQGALEDEVAVHLYARARAAGLTSGGRVNLGAPGDYRVPDGGYYRGASGPTYQPSAAIVVEILSPRRRDL